MAYSYNRLLIQGNIRNESIRDNIKDGNTSFYIPNFFWPSSFKRGDSVDKFSSESAMGKMYGVKSIDAFEPYFDYSILADGEKTKTNVDMPDGSNINCIIIGNNGLIGGSSIAAVVDQKKNDSIKVNIKIIDSDGNNINI
ncbi:hypothetical protein Q4Q66_19750, partial [Morganella morganii]